MPRHLVLALAACGQVHLAPKHHGPNNALQDTWSQCGEGAPPLVTPTVRPTRRQQKWVAAVGSTAREHLVVCAESKPGSRHWKTPAVACPSGEGDNTCGPLVLQFPMGGSPPGLPHRCPFPQVDESAVNALFEGHTLQTTSCMNVPFESECKGNVVDLQARQVSCLAWTTAGDVE